MENEKNQALTHVTLTNVFVTSFAALSKDHRLTFSCDTTHAQIGEFTRDEHKKVVFIPTDEFPLPIELDVHRTFTGLEKGEGVTAQSWQKDIQAFFTNNTPIDIQGFVSRPNEKRPVWQFSLSCIASS